MSQYYFLVVIIFASCSIFRDNDNICESTDFKVTINPSDLKTYFFLSGKDTLQQSAMNNFTFNSLRKDTSFTLRALDFNGCYSKMSDTFRIVVHPIPSMKSESLYVST